MNTPPIYVYANTNYPNNPPNDAGGQQLSTLEISFIALGAFIALLLTIGLIILIYNLCRYGTCCPPNAYPGCCPETGCRCCCWPCYCATCCDQPPGEVQYVKRTPSIRTSYGTGSYVGRGTRFNQGSYMVEPRTIRSGTLGRRGSLVIVDDGTLSRRRRGSVRVPSRPQVLVANRLSEPSRMSTLGRRRSVRLVPAPSARSSVRCYARNDPVTYGDLDDFGDGDVRVIVRNQPYTSQATLIDAAGPAFSNVGYDYDNGAQHSAVVDVDFDQAPEYSSDFDDVQQQGRIYPVLSQQGFY